ncbi:MAG: Uma2 family endonuclease [Chloroflexi bacterium]|nr:Uma2 family endonuclease [Chloroflexota bacterium]
MAPIDIPHPHGVGLLDNFFLARLPKSKRGVAKIIQAQRRLFTVDEYYKMAEAGIFTEDDRVELLEGEIVQMPPIGSPHGGTVKQLIRLFTSRLGDRAIVSAQDPVRLADNSEPQPDIAVLRPRPDFYRASHPMPEEVLLLVEVGDSTIAYDRQVKVLLYARAGIPEVWLVDLTAQRVEVYQGPSAQGYAEARLVGRDSMLMPSAFPDVTVRVDEVLG